MTSGETNRHMDQVQFEAAQNTCEILRAIDADGEKTRAKITENEIQVLRDKVAEFSQARQNDTLIAALRPYPTPTYQTCNPQYPVGGTFNGAGCGCGIGYGFA